MKVNTIYCGDCRDVMIQHIPDESVDLIYADPPFFSNRNYEVIWGDGYELRAFEDRWKGGIENYLSWMDDKLRECHRVLKDTGSIYLHCDWHASHYLKILMDKIFGMNNFQNEVIWHYRTGGATNKRFSRKHDTILFYSKSKNYNFNQQKEKAYTKSENRKPGIVNYGAGISEFYEDGKGVYCNVNMRDVWEISYINSQAKERLGYPTQKPEKLLERIVKASSNPTDIILDPFCGCGTAIAMAQKLGRRWIGIDVSPSACRLMKERMRKITNVKIEIIGLPKTLEEISAMQPFEFQNWVCQKLVARVSKKKTGDMGIDGWMIDGRPIQVKQSERVGRNVVDNFETAMRRSKRDRGIIVALSFTSGCYEEVARANNHDNVDIELLTAKELIDR